MTRLLLIIVLFSLLLTCNSSKEKELLKKENELLKREIEIQKKETITYKKQQNTVSAPVIKQVNVDDKVSEIKSLLNRNSWETVKIDNKGNFSFDLGSASAGRISGNLKDLILSIEHKPERPGCADVCPPMKIIYFKCQGTNKCVTDPIDPKTYGYYNKGSISFENLKRGTKTYELLSLIQKNI